MSKAILSTVLATQELENALLTCSLKIKAIAIILVNVLKFHKQPMA